MVTSESKSDRQIYVLVAPDYDMPYLLTDKNYRDHPFIAPTRSVEDVPKLSKNSLVIRVDIPFIQWFEQSAQGPFRRSNMNTVPGEIHSVISGFLNGTDLRNFAVSSKNIWENVKQMRPDYFALSHPNFVKAYAAVINHPIVKNKPNTMPDIARVYNDDYYMYKSFDAYMNNDSVTTVRSHPHMYKMVHNQDGEQANVLNNMIVVYYKFCRLAKSKNELYEYLHQLRQLYKYKFALVGGRSDRYNLYQIIDIELLKISLLMELANYDPGSKNLPSILTYLKAALSDIREYDIETHNSRVINHHILCLIYINYDIAVVNNSMLTDSLTRMINNELVEFNPPTTLITKPLTSKLNLAAAIKYLSDSKNNLYNQYPYLPVPELELL